MKVSLCSIKVDTPPLLLLLSLLYHQAASHLTPLRFISCVISGSVFIVLGYRRSIGNRDFHLSTSVMRCGHAARPGRGSLAINGARGGPRAYSGPNNSAIYISPSFRPQYLLA